MTRRLLIIDHYDLDWLERAVAVTAATDDWQLLALGISADWFAQRFRVALDRLGHWRLIDLASMSSAATTRVNTFVLDFIARLPTLDLGGVTLADLLAAPEGNHWWYLETSEKSPLRSPLIGQFYRLALIRLALERETYDEIWLEVHEAPLRLVIERCQLAGLQSRGHTENSQQAAPSGLRVLAGCLRSAFAAAGSVIVTRLMLKIMRWPAPRLDADLILLTFYPYNWLNAFGATATERFFAARPHGLSTIFAAWLTQPRQLWQHRQAAKTVAHTRGLIALQRFVGVRAMLGLLQPRLIWRAILCDRRLRSHLRVEFAGFDVAEFVSADVRRALMGAEFCLARLMFAALDNFSRHAHTQGWLYRAEFQPWENAMLFGIGPRFKTIGFRHSPFGENYLPMRFAPGELTGRQSGQNRPLPDAMLVSGPIGAQRLGEDGYPAERIAVCGPQRHADLVAYLQHPVSRVELRKRLDLPADLRVLFVAIAVIEADTQALFAALAQLGDALGNFRLIVKTHPARPLGDAAMRAAFDIIGADRASVLPVTVNMYDAISASDVMVCIGSTIAFEALALGVLPIVFENPATFPLTSLAEFEAALFVVRTADELRDALEATGTDTERAQAKRRAWPETLAQVFGNSDAPLPDQLRQALDQLF